MKVLVEIVVQERVQAAVVVGVVIWVNWWIDATDSGSGGSDLRQTVGGFKRQKW